jgi:hypothetical protein
VRDRTVPILSEHFKGQIVDRKVWADLTGGGGSFTRIETSDPHSLREWWYAILRNYGKYPCYAIFLVLPSDKEAAEFLKESGRELHIISGRHCLIIVLGVNFFCTVGLNDDFWIEASTKHITTGESIQIAELFDVELTEFPGIVFFHDVRSSNFAFVSLKDLKKEGIKHTLREIFSLIRKQEDNPEEIMNSIRDHLRLRKLHRKQNQVKHAATAFIGKTIETVMEAWVKATVK